MRYSSFNWVEHRKRGWIFGPFFGRMLTITVTKHTDWTTWEIVRERFEPDDIHDAAWEDDE